MAEAGAMGSMHGIYSTVRDPMRSHARIGGSKFQQEGKSLGGRRDERDWNNNCALNAVHAFILHSFIEIDLFIHFTLTLVT